jgi:hypothetical protein
MHILIKTSLHYAPILCVSCEGTQKRLLLWRYILNSGLSGLSGFKNEISQFLGNKLLHPPPPHFRRSCMKIRFRTLTFATSTFFRKYTVKMTYECSGCFGQRTREAKLRDMGRPDLEKTLHRSATLGAPKRL